MRFADKIAMLVNAPRSTTRVSSDIIWDAGLHATAFVDNGAPLVAGADVGWTPALLMATAISASLMTRIIQAANAAKLEILGYVSEQRVDLDGPSVISIGLTPTITVRSRVVAEALEPIVLAAVHALPDSPGYELAIEPRITIAPVNGTRWM